MNPNSEIVPSFNTLVLLRVGHSSKHIVEAVNDLAAAPRIALTRCYLSVRRSGEREFPLSG